MFCCSVIVDRPDRGVVNLSGLQTRLCFKWLLGPVAMYTGRAPGVFVQDAEFLCAHACFLLIVAPFLVRKLCCLMILA